jgi:ERCC4-related helicase
MATTKTERAGVGFGIARQAGPIILEVRTHHDTISALRGVQVGFELLNGITAEQAKKILDVLNENVIGVLVTTSVEDEAAAAR